MINDFACIRDQIEQFGLALPHLIKALKSDDIKMHPKWGSVIPYDVQVYGCCSSPGHCIRPDIVLTEQGPRVVELDFVASGRGFTLNVLSKFSDGESRQRDFLRPFAEWYQSMGHSSILYSTATLTSSYQETSLFSEALEKYFSVDIRACNIDTSHYLWGLIDRLSYRYEMYPQDPDRLYLSEDVVTTAEPYLDSKAIFALIHDVFMEQVLLRHMPMSSLCILREMMPASYLLENVSDESLARIKAVRDQWVIKSTDVEAYHSWGARGTIIGRKYSDSKFAKTLDRIEIPNKKDLGRHPIVQRFEESIDFTDMWNDVLINDKPQADLVSSASDLAQAKQKIYGRIGVYYLICNKIPTVTMPPFAVLTLRPDVLVHGASNAMVTALRI